MKVANYLKRFITELDQQARNFQDCMAFHKCHKNFNNPPYRPILSMRNSYVSNLAIYLDQLLKPYLPIGFAVKDMFEFLEKIKSKNLPNDCFLVSYDVVSLFTNVSLKDTIDFICSLIDFTSFVFNRRTFKTLLQMACCDIVFSLLPNRRSGNGFTSRSYFSRICHGQD